MQLLTVLTLIYAGVLVLALAVSLIAIRLRLGAIDHALEGARASLGRVCAASEPLHDELAPIEERLKEALRSVNEAADELDGAHDAIEQRAERVPAASTGG